MKLPAISSRTTAGLAAGVVLGAGVGLVAPSLAADGGTASSTQQKAAHAGHKGDHRAGLARARNVIHATWTTRNGVHHRAIRGTVEAVSSSSITVKATDGVTETYRVVAATGVRVLGDGHPGKDAIGDVKVGDRALVAGTGSTDAGHVVARPAKTGAKASASSSDATS